MHSSKAPITTSRVVSGFSRVLFALLAISSAVCAGAESGPVATSQNPPPPTFQTRTVEVALGEHGGTVTLMAAEDGSFTLAGETFTGGADNPVEGEGGRIYVLTLVDGTWSAAFQSMEVTVPLGASGELVTLMTVEDGSFTLGGMDFVSGGTASNSTGATYTLTRGEDGTWTAAFLPMSQTVPLGTSGNAIELVTNEAGMWTISGNALAGDGTDTHAEGSLVYALAMGEGGVWAATFVPATQTVPLGTSGDSVTLSSTEAGGWSLDGEAVVDGAVTMNAAGESYALAMAEDGTWTAAHRPMQAPVSLGASGITVTLVTNEDGRWTHEGQPLSSGATVEGGLNAATGVANEYELTLAEGTWTAIYRPLTMTVAGTSMLAMAREDGSGYTVGDATLPASGTGEVTDPRGAMYRVAKDADGGLAGTRYDLPMAGDAMSVDSMTEAADTANDAPTLIADDRQTAADESGTMLRALGAGFSMGELLDRGAAAASGPNIVARAHEEIAKIRDRVAALVELRRADGISSGVFDTQVHLQWGKADAAVTNIFGDAGGSLERTTSESRVVDAFDRLVDALSSEEAFAAATLAGGPDKLQGFANRTATQATAAFNRAEWVASATLGTLGSTRFGAAAYNSTGTATATLGDAERGQGFAWSTVESTRRTSDVQTAGSAYYTGATRAADEAGQLYAGAIEVEVRFASKKVDGLVIGLAHAETGRAWSYGLGGEVTDIVLPTATLNRRSTWSVRAGDGEGRLRYAPDAGGSEDFDFSGGAFSGRLLGQGEAAGKEALGTWKVEVGNRVLAGGFGVQRTKPPAQQAAEERARNRFETALSEAGLEDAGAVDPEDSEAVAAVVSQFQTALEASGYGTTAVTRIVASFRASLLLGAPDQNPLRVALSAFSAAQTDGSLPSTSVSPIDALVGDYSAGTAVVRRDGVQAAGASVKTTVNIEKNRLDLAATPDDDPLIVGLSAPAFEVPLAGIFGGEYPVTSKDNLAKSATSEVKKATHVAEARKEIQRLYNVLTRVVGLDGGDASDQTVQFVNDRRQSVFDEIQAQLTDELFGTPGGDVLTKRGSALDGTAAARWTAHTDYPTNDQGVAQDTTVLTEIRDVLEALADADAFEEAFESGGIFDEVNRYAADHDRAGELIVPLDHVFNKDTARLLLTTDTTDFTRFGVWQKHSSRYAADYQALNATWRLQYDGYRQEIAFGEPFAYSPLDQAVARGINDPAYPVGARAKYEGKSTAYQHNIFYTGGLRAAVFWDSAEVGGQMRVEILEPMATDPGFGPLRHGLHDYRSRFKPGTHDVSALVFTADITVDGTGKLGFSGTDLEIRYARGDLKGDRSAAPLVAPIINTLSVDRGRLLVRHSGTNNSDWRRHYANSTELRLDLFDTSNPPAIGETVVLGRSEIDTFNNTFNTSTSSALKLIAGQYSRYEESAGRFEDRSDPRAHILLTFEDGTTIHNWVLGLDNNGSADIQSHSGGRGSKISVSYQGGLFDEFFSTGNGRGYLNVGYPKGPPATASTLSSDADQNTGRGTGSGGSRYYPLTQVFGEVLYGSQVGTASAFAIQNLPTDSALAKRGIDAPADLSTAVIDGKFVGQHTDGPLGLIGVWSLPGEAVSFNGSSDGERWTDLFERSYRDHWLGVGNQRGEISGAFGADIAPSP